MLADEVTLDNVKTNHLPTSYMQQPYFTSMPDDFTGWWESNVS